MWWELRQHRLQEEPAQGKIMGKISTWISISEVVESHDLPTVQTTPVFFFLIVTSLYIYIYIWWIPQIDWFQIHTNSSSLNTFYLGKMKFMHEPLAATHNDTFTHANLFWQTPKPLLPRVNWWTFSQSAFFLDECQAWMVGACFSPVLYCTGIANLTVFMSSVRSMP